jgi:ribosomal protein L22
VNTLCWQHKLTVMSWNKLLPKTTEKFREVINHLRGTQLPDLAREYADLRNTIINTKLRSFFRYDDYSKTTQNDIAGGVQLYSYSNNNDATFFDVSMQDDMYGC